MSSKVQITSRPTALDADLIISGTGNYNISLRDFPHVSIHCIGTSSLAFKLQGSNDNANYIDIAAWTTDSHVSAGTTITPAAGSVYNFDASPWTYARLVVSAGTGTLSVWGFSSTSASSGNAVRIITDPVLTVSDEMVDETTDETVIAAPGAGQQIIILGGSIIANEAATTERTVGLYNGASTGNDPVVECTCRDGRPVAVFPRTLSANTALVYKASGAGTYRVNISYTLGDA